MSGVSWIRFDHFRLDLESEQLLDADAGAAADAEGVRRARPPGGPRRAADEQAGAARRGLGRALRQRRGAQGGGARDPQGARRRRAPAALRRDRPPQGLSLHRRARRRRARRGLRRRPGRPAPGRPRRRARRAPPLARPGPRRPAPGGLRRRRARDRQDHPGRTIPRHRGHRPRLLASHRALPRAVWRRRALSAGARGARPPVRRRPARVAAERVAALRAHLAQAAAGAAERAGFSGARARDPGSHSRAHVAGDGRGARGPDRRGAAGAGARGPALERLRHPRPGLAARPASGAGALAADRDLQAGGRALGAIIRCTTSGGSWSPAANP